MAKNRSKGTQRLRSRAQNNVELYDASQNNLANQQLQQAQDDYLRSLQAGQSIYGGYQDTLSQLPRPQFGQIGDQYDKALGTVSDMFTGAGNAAGMDPAEVQAGLGLGQANADVTHTMLANEAAREGMFRSSAAREGDLAQRYYGDQAQQDMRDAMTKYNDQLTNIRSDDPWQIQQEYDRLRQQQVENKLAQSKMASDQAFSSWLQNYLGGSGAPSGGGNGGGGGGGGGGGAPTGHQVDRPGGGQGGGQRPGDFGGAGAHQHGATDHYPTTSPQPGVGYGANTYTPPNNGPFGPAQTHPLANYVQGNMNRGIHEMGPRQADYIRSHIQQYYSNGHQNLFPRTPYSQDPTPSIHDLIQSVQQRYYNGAQR